MPIARSAPEPPARARSEEDEDDAADESRPQPARRAHSRWPVLLVAGVLAIIVWLERDLILSGLGAVVQSVVLFAVAVWLARMVISSIGRGF